MAYMTAEFRPRRQVPTISIYILYTYSYARVVFNLISFFHSPGHSWNIHFWVRTFSLGWARRRFGAPRSRLPTRINN